MLLLLLLLLTAHASCIMNHAVMLNNHCFQ
jgi:hypothetical protein